MSVIETECPKLIIDSRFHTIIDKEIVVHPRDTYKIIFSVITNRQSRL